MSLSLVTQLWVDGAWATYPGYSEDGWEISVGPDVETGLRANSLSVTLNNDTLAMDPSRVTSALYGKIGRNTRARMLINGFTLTTAEASSWQPDATVEHVPGAARGKSWTDLTAEGLLRRLGRWTDPIRSAMTRTAKAYPGLLGYWALEDESGSAQLNNEVASGPPTAISGTLSLGGSEGAGGSAESVKMGSDGNMRGRFVQTGTVTGYQVSWAAKLSAVPAAATFLPMMVWVDNAGRAYRINVNNASFGLEVTAADGTLLIATSGIYTSIPPNQWMQYMVKVTVTAGTVSVGLSWYPQDGSTITGFTDTFSSATTGRPVRWTAWGNAYTDGAGYGHVLAISDTSFALDGPGPVQAFNGYLGETTWERFRRLMVEEGLTGYRGGPPDYCVKMGRQKPGVLLDLIEECVRTEGGLLYDEPTDIALMFVTNRNLVNRTPVLTLTKSQVVAPLRKTIDDVGVVNDVTVKNAEGSSARVELAAGALSTDVPPAGVGRVKGTLEVNMSRLSKLGNRANWELRKGTLDRPRYLQVTVDLLANPSLTNTVTNARPGDWITLSGVEPDTITLRIISINRKGGAVEDMATFNCLPAELYQVGVYNAASSRYDSASTTLAAAITTTVQTSIALTTAAYNDRWSTSTPYDIKVAGERMTVTAMTAGAGTGPVTQTATVTRAVNGVAKTHVIGTEVHIFAPVRYALT